MDSGSGGLKVYFERWPENKQTVAAVSICKCRTTAAPKKNFHLSHIKM